MGAVVAAATITEAHSDLKAAIEAADVHPGVKTITRALKPVNLASGVAGGLAGAGAVEGIDAGLEAVGLDPLIDTDVAPVKTIIEGAVSGGVTEAAASLLQERTAEARGLRVRLGRQEEPASRPSLEKLAPLPGGQSLAAARAPWESRGPTRTNCLC